MFASKLEVVTREAGAMDPDQSEYVLTVAGAMSLMINSAGAGAMSQRTTKAEFTSPCLVMAQCPAKETELINHTCGGKGLIPTTLLPSFSLRISTVPARCSQQIHTSSLSFISLSTVSILSSFFSPNIPQPHYTQDE